MEVQHQEEGVYRVLALMAGPKEAVLLVAALVEALRGGHLFTELVIMKTIREKILSGPSCGLTRRKPGQRRSWRRAWTKIMPLPEKLWSSLRINNYLLEVLEADLL